MKCKHVSMVRAHIFAFLRLSYVIRFLGYTLQKDGNCVREINEDPVPVCPEGRESPKMLLLLLLHVIFNIQLIIAAAGWKFHIY